MTGTSLWSTTSFKILAWIEKTRSSTKGNNKMSLKYTKRRSLRFTQECRRGKLRGIRCLWDHLNFIRRLLCKSRDSQNTRIKTNRERVPNTVSNLQWTHDLGEWWGIEVQRVCTTAVRNFCNAIRWDRIGTHARSNTKGKKSILLSSRKQTQVDSGSLIPTKVRIWVNQAG